MLSKWIEFSTVRPTQRLPNARRDGSGSQIILPRPWQRRSSFGVPPRSIKNLPPCRPNVSGAGRGAVAPPRPPKFWKDDAVMTKQPATPATPAAPAAMDSEEHAGSLQTANGVLEIYSDGEPDPWKRVREQYPEFVNKGWSAPGMTYRRFTAETVLVWAAGVVAGDHAKQAMAARVFQHISDIALDKNTKPTVRLNALKLLGRACGLFAKKPGGGVKIPLSQIQRVIVDPWESSAKSIDPVRGNG